MLAALRKTGYICAGSTAPLGNTISQTAIWAVFSTQRLLQKNSTHF